MKVLIYGSRGWIGQQVKALLSQSHEVYDGICRIDDDEKLQQEIEDVNPTHVFCLVGRTHGEGIKTIDYLEQKGKILYNVRDNLYSPLSLALLCKEKGIHLTYLGTGCIFSGEPDVLFSENSKPNFFESSYSVVKGFTDRIFHNPIFASTVLNVRIRMPITSDVNDRNFITKISKYEKICSIENSMSVLPTLLPIMIDMALVGKTGTINLVNPGVITHNEILELYKEIVDPEFTWKNFNIEEQNAILAAGRSNNHLDTSYLENLYPEVPNIRSAVIETLHKMKENISSV